MDKDSKESSGSFQAQGILWIALLAAGFAFVPLIPWKSSRPPGPPAEVAEHVTAQDVDARLWQDPIGAVGRERKARAETAGSGRGGKAHHPDPHSVEKFIERVYDLKDRGRQSGSTDAPDPIFLAVMVQGGPYPEDAEARRRIRYAVLAAMSQKGYVAVDPDHLGYFEPYKSDNKNAFKPRPPDNKSDFKLPEFIPYEQLDHDLDWERDNDSQTPARAQPGSGGTQDAKAKRPVWLLWLDDSFFVTDVVHKMELLAENLVKRTKSCLKVDSAARGYTPPAADRPFVVLGPTSSYALRDMAEKVGGQGVSKGGASQRARDCLTFYAYSATASDAAILEKLLQASPSHLKSSDGAGAGHPTRLQTLPVCDRSAHQSDNKRSPAPGNDSAELSRFFLDKRLLVYRTVTTDVMLARKIAEELRLRGINPAEVNNASGGAHPAREDERPGISAAAVAAEHGRPSATQTACPAAQRGNWQHVVLISDWDTLYGRSAQRALGEALARPASHTSHTSQANQASQASCQHQWLHRFSYPRGLDGQLPASQPSASGTDKPKARSKDARASSEEQQRSIERAEGESQYDYLRRLGQRLLALDNELLRQERGRIRAIGVLGSDLHDKLLLLQALRPLFPDAVFFTTELDARFLHPEELGWSRNLLVASGYGFELDPALQSSTPPFRNSLQTASYLSTLVAVHNAHACRHHSGEATACIDQAKITQWLAEPRMFQIASDAAFDLSTRQRPPSDKLGSPASKRSEPDANCSAQRLSDCLIVHPAPSELYRLPAARTMSWPLALAGLGLWTLVLATGGLNQPKAPLPLGASIVPRGAARSSRLRLVAGFVLLLLALLCEIFHGPEQGPLKNFADRLTQHGHGEPFALGGISVWPAVGTKILTLGVAIGCIAWGWGALDQNTSKTAEKVLFKPEWDSLVETFKARSDTWLWRDRLLRAFSYRPRDEDFVPDEHWRMSAPAVAFWQKYIYQGRWQARLLRIGAATILYAAVAYWLAAALGEPSVPSRGQVSRWLEWIIGNAASLATFFLIWFVVDATVLCAMFIQDLRDRIAPLNGEGAAATKRADASGIIWSDIILDRHNRQFDMPRRYLESWVSLRCIDLRTRLVGSLVYLPFIALSLMILSHNALSHTWKVPLSLSIVVGCSVLIVTVCAILIRVRAEGARRRAIQTLRAEAILLTSGSEPQAKRVEQLQAMIEQIQALRTGAFGPYSQQPVFKALILPLATYGGTFVLEYLAVTNL